MKRVIFIVIVLHCLYVESFAQVLRYDIVRNGHSIGFTLVEKSVEGDKAVFHINTLTRFRAIWQIEVEYDLLETFRGDTLVSGTNWSTINKRKQKETELAKDGPCYTLTIDGIRTVVHDPGITKSVSRLYFEEPKHREKVFSAYFGKYLVFEKVGDHQYKLTSPDGSNIYSYENGICTEVKISRDFATFSQVLKHERLATLKNNNIEASSLD